MSLLRFNSEILEVKQITPTVKHFTLKAPVEFEFKPGQFVYLVLELPSGKVKKPYSIASSPREGEIDLCIKKVEGGRATPYIHELKEGAILEVIGPFGTFTLKDPTKDITFIATGTGLAPFRSMIPGLLKNSNKTVTLITGVRHEDEVLYEDEFLLLKEKYKNFHYHSSCTRPGASFKGHCGRVQSVIEKEVTDFSAEFYLCGLSPMIHDVMELLISKGAQKTSIHFERYD